MIDLARQSFRFRELIATFIGRELRARYRGSLLGASWIVIQPLLYLVVYFVVFVKILDSGFDLSGLHNTASPHPLAEEYVRKSEAVFALSMLVGLIPWIAFQETLMRASTCILENGNLIKKYTFPAQILPLYLVGVGLFNTTVALAVLAVVVWFVVGGLPAFVWLLPVLLLLQGIFTLGLCYMASAVTVFVRDVIQILPMLMTFWFFLSPIFYVTRGLRQTLPDAVVWIINLNPLRYLIEAYREMFVFYPGLGPDTPLGHVPWGFVGIFAAISVAALLAGYGLFMKLRPSFADEV